eukprot:TRINITY_DN17202_c0_g1_i1.p1 TRINITY_DN17202_c0_g1~~TRINITY_DN17202_c0_g1_i1.p1  ORF type:complete len:253 (+),score=57.16 TRINITY_DN17202_c0_g1_i1:64-822(+)
MTAKGAAAYIVAALVLQALSPCTDAVRSNKDMQMNEAADAERPRGRRGRKTEALAEIPEETGQSGSPRVESKEDWIGTWVIKAEGLWKGSFVRNLTFEVTEKPESLYSGLMNGKKYTYKVEGELHEAYRKAGPLSVRVEPCEQNGIFGNWSDVRACKATIGYMAEAPADLLVPQAARQRRGLVTHHGAGFGGNRYGRIGHVADMIEKYRVIPAEMPGPLLWDDEEDCFIYKGHDLGDGSYTEVGTLSLCMQE